LEKTVYEYLSQLRSDFLQTGTIDVLDFISVAYGGSLELHLILGTDTYADLANYKWKESARFFIVYSSSFSLMPCFPGYFLQCVKSM